MPSIGLAIVIHVLLLTWRPGLWGGGDLVPHMGIIESVRFGGWLQNTYAPLYHWLGSLLVPAVGMIWFARAFAFGSAIALIAGFRAFQRAARLPDECTAIFALTPYLLSLSWTLPRVEAAGLALLLFGLAALLHGRHAVLAGLLAASFYVHTASALLFGLSAGVLALSRRDFRALGALSVGALGAVPLVWAHLADGCSVPEAFLFSRGGYARQLRESLLPRNWPWLPALAGPVGLVAAALGARRLWAEQRALAWMCLVLALLYLSNFWLAPFGVRTLVTPLRGLSLFAIPVSIAAGLASARTRTLSLGTLAATAAFALAACPWVIPHAAFTRSIDLAEGRRVEVERCAFRWKKLRPFSVAPDSRPLWPGVATR